MDLTSYVFVDILDRKYKEITNNLYRLSLEKLNYIQSKLNLIIKNKLETIVNKYNTILCSDLIPQWNNIDPVVNAMVRIVDEKTIVVFIVPGNYSPIGIQFDLDKTIYYRKNSSPGFFDYIKITDLNLIQTEVLWKEELIRFLSDLYNEI